MTFKRPTRAGWAALAIAALCVAGFVDVAFAEDAAPGNVATVTNCTPV